MKPFLLPMFSLIFLSCNQSVGPIEAMHDNWNYESITGSKGTVYTKKGDIHTVYDSVTIIYSEADATTMLIKTKLGKYVYIQGPAVIEFDSFNADKWR